MSKWMVCEMPWLQPHAIRKAEERLKEAAEREAERGRRLTEEQRARERRRNERLRRLRKLFEELLALAFLFGLALALFQWLFDLEFAHAVLSSAILFLAVWVWSVRNEVSDLSNKIAETAPDADSTGRSARDGG